MISVFLSDLNTTRRPIAFRHLRHNSSRRRPPTVASLCMVSVRGWFLTEKRSFLNASCCSFEVMKGGTGLRLRSRAVTFATLNVAASRSARTFAA